MHPKILVVDDETALQAVISDTLADQYSVIVATTGREGVMKAAHIKPDVILMDLMMPDMGGVDAVRELQSRPETRRIPVIIMTAHNSESQTVQEIKTEPNVAGFLAKPFRPKEIRHFVKSAIEGKTG